MPRRSVAGNPINVYVHARNNDFWRTAKNSVYGPGSFLCGAEYRDLQNICNDNIRDTHPFSSGRKTPPRSAPSSPSTAVRPSRNGSSPSSSSPRREKATSSVSSYSTSEPCAIRVEMTESQSCVDNLFPHMKFQFRKLTTRSFLMSLEFVDNY